MKDLAVASFFFRSKVCGVRSLHSLRDGPEPGDIEIFAEWYDISACGKKMGPIPKRPLEVVGIRKLQAVRGRPSDPGR